MSYWTVEQKTGDSPAFISVNDGHRLAYAEYGDPAGVPVLFLHGTPGSRLLGSLFADHAEDAGVRLLAVDRPGFGRSPPLKDQPKRDVGWFVPAVLDTIGIETVGIIAFTGAVDTLLGPLRETEPGFHEWISSPERHRPTSVRKSQEHNWLSRSWLPRLHSCFEAYFEGERGLQIALIQLLSSGSTQQAIPRGRFHQLLQTASERTSSKFSRYPGVELWRNFETQRWTGTSISRLSTPSFNSGTATTTRTFLSETHSDSKRIFRTPNYALWNRQIIFRHSFGVSRKF